MTRTPLFWDFGPFGTRRCGVLNDSCCGSLCRTKSVLQLSVVLVSVVSTKCLPSAPCSAGGDHRNRHVCVCPHCFLNWQFQHLHFGPHKEVSSTLRSLEQSSVSASRCPKVQKTVEAQDQHVYRVVDVPVFHNKHNNPDSPESWKLLRFSRNRALDIPV